MKIDLCFNPRNISKEEVEKNLHLINEVMKNYKIPFAYLFGSIIIESHSSQDADIAIYIENPTQSIFDYYNDIYFDLCKIFRADNIDLLILNNVNPIFRYEVIKKGRLIYCPYPEVLIKFTEKTLFEYEDIKYLKKEYQRELHKRVKEGFLMAKREINKEKIYTFTDNINKALDEIKLNLEGIDNFDAFKENKDKRELCVHYLRISLESLFDICRHIISVKGFGIPDMENENLIDVLGSKNVIPLDFSKKIRGMQGMRNAIVHVYWNLDYKKIYQVVKESLKDFENFVRYIFEYIEREDK